MKDLMDSEGDETSISKFKRMIRMIAEFKNTCKNKSMKSKRMWINFHMNSMGRQRNN
jgi:hypothetical protein